MRNWLSHRVRFFLCVFFKACTAVTRPILLGELLGLENVNNAYGFMLVFYGVATLFGTPMAGMHSILLIIYFLMLCENVD